MTSEDCPQCKANSPIHDFNLACCRTRFLIAQPSKQARQGWLDRWRKQDGGKVVDEIKQRLLAYSQSIREQSKAGS